jgi:hypothetical protein
LQFLITFFTRKTFLTLQHFSYCNFSAVIFFHSKIKNPFITLLSHNKYMKAFQVTLGIVSVLFSLPVHSSSLLLSQPLPNSPKPQIQTFGEHHL